ncbi:MAG: DUF177 domain-containing protein [Rhodoferax sp.]|nr:DUF177 domain-containing protein [Rhodoferax sp.]
MKHAFDPKHLHIHAFAHAAGQLAGEETLAHFERLLEVVDDKATQTPVHYSASGELRSNPERGETAAQVWLHLSGKTLLPLVCQRCLEPVDVVVEFARDFRFVANEALAAVEDEASEEDVLVLSKDFNLLELVEDELLLATPLVPKHPVCPQPLKLQVADADFVDTDANKPHPFSVLEQLKHKP